jgi:hypothetical protein
MSELQIRDSNPFEYIRLMTVKLKSNLSFHFCSEINVVTNVYFFKVATTTDQLATVITTMITDGVAEEEARTLEEEIITVWVISTFAEKLSRKCGIYLNLVFIKRKVTFRTCQ